MEKTTTKTTGKEEIVEIGTKDFLRGDAKKGIILRFNPENAVKLPCYCRYDKNMPRENGNEVMIIKKIEIKDEDGTWDLYPSITWLDGVENNEQLVTRAIVKLSNGKVEVMTSAQGFPDGKLMNKAEEVGISVESFVLC